MNNKNYLLRNLLLMITLGLIFLTQSQSSPIGDETLKGIHGDYRNIHARKDLIFAQSPRGVDIYKIIDSDSLDLRHSINIPYEVKFFNLFQNILFLYNNQDEVIIYDVFDYENPDSLAKINGIDSLVEMSFVEGRLYLGQLQNLKVYSMKTPNSPQLLLSYDFTQDYPTNKLSHFTVNHHFFYGAFSRGFYVYDIRDLENISLKYNDVTDQYYFSNKNFFTMSIKDPFFEDFDYFTGSSLLRNSGISPGNSTLKAPNNIFQHAYTNEQLFQRSDDEIYCYNTIETNILNVYANSFIGDSAEYTAVTNLRGTTFAAGYTETENFIKGYSTNLTRSYMDTVFKFNPGDSIIDLERNDSIMVALSKDSLYFFNITDSANVTKTNQLSLPGGNGVQISLYQDRLFIAASTAGLYQIHDISDASRLGNGDISLFSSGDITAVQLSPFLLSFHDRNSQRIKIHRLVNGQISNQLSAFISENDSVYDIAMDDRNLYTAHRAGGVKIFNISNLRDLSTNTQPDTILIPEAGESYYKVYSHDDILSIAAGKGGLKIYFNLYSGYVKEAGTYTKDSNLELRDVSPELNLFHTVTSQLDPGVLSLRFYNNNMDITKKQPYHFNCQLSYHRDSINHLSMDNDRFYFSTQSDSIIYYNLNSKSDNSPNATSGGRYGFGGYGEFKNVQSIDTLLVVSSFDSLKTPVVSIFNSNTDLISNIPLPSSASAFALHKSNNDSLYAYFIANRQLIPYNITDPANPQAKTAIEFADSLIDMDSDGNRLYVLDESKAYIYQLNTPSEPVKSSESTMAHTPLKIHCSGSSAYMMDINHRIYNIGSSSGLAAESEMDLPENMMDMDCHENYSYYLSENGNLYSKNAHSSIQRIYSGLTDNPQSLKVDDHFIMIFHNENGHTIFERSQALGAPMVKTPAYHSNESGCYNHSIQKMFISENSAIRVYDMDTTNFNHPPAFVNTIPKEDRFMSRVDYEYALTAEDPDNDPLNYSILGSIPANAALNNNIFTFSPSDNQTGNHTIYFQVSDNRGGIDIDTVNITVIAHQDPPGNFNLTFPINDTVMTEKNITFRWEASSNAHDYTLIYTEDTTAATMDTIHDIKTLYFQKNFENLTENGLYFWKVSANLNYDLYSTENTGGFQSFIYSAIADPPTIPTLVKPIGDTVISTQGTAIAFTKSTPVEPEATVHSYIFQLSESVDFTNPYFSDEFVEAEADSTRGDTLFFRLRKSIKENFHYFWRIAAKQENGAQSDFSQPDSFVVNFTNNSPSSFSLISPDSSINIGAATSAELKWEASIDPDHGDFVRYHLRVGATPTFSIVIADDTLSDTTYQLNDLTENKIYYWKVTAFDSFGRESSCKENGYFFYKNEANDKPGNPYGYYPANGETIKTTLVNLEITNSFDADPYDHHTYQFFLYKDYNRQQLIKQSEWVEENPKGRTSYELPTLDDDTEYFWVAVCSDGQATSEMPIHRFLIDRGNQKPNSFELISPKDDSLTLETRPTFRWNATTDPDPTDTDVWYRLQICEDYQFRDNIIDISGLTSTSLKINQDLPVDERYYWRVGAYDNDGAIRYSLHRVLKISSGQVAPLAPSPHSPSDGALVTNKNPVLSFNNAYDENTSDIITYQIYLDTVPSFDSPARTVYNDVPEIPGNRTSFTVTEDLKDNFRYYWRVRAYDQDDYSPLSSTRSFTVNYQEEPPERFSLISPEKESVVSQSAVFRWDQASDPDPMDDVTYRLDIYNSPELTEKTAFFQAIEDTFYVASSLNSLNDNETYYWQVTASDDIGLQAKSDTFSFLFDSDNSLPPLDFDLISPEKNANGIPLNPVFIWNKTSLPNNSEGAVRYLLSYSPLNQPNQSQTIMVTDTQHTLANKLEPNTAYQWSVTAFSAINTADSTRCTPEFSVFITRGDLPAPLTDFRAVVTPTHVQFSWKYNSVLPYDTVKVFSDIGTGTINYEYPYKTAAANSEQLMFPVWNTKNKYCFSVQAYDAQGAESQGYPIEFSLFPDTQIPVMKYPSPNCALQGNRITFFSHSPFHQGANSDYSLLFMLTENSGIPLNTIPMAAPLWYDFDLNAYYQTLSNNPKVFDANGLFFMGTEMGSSSQTNTNGFYCSQTKPNLIQSMDNNNNQTTLVQLNKGQAAGFASSLSMTLPFCYAVDVPPVTENQFLLSSSYVSFNPADITEDVLGITEGQLLDSVETIFNYAFSIQSSQFHLLTDSIQVNVIPAKSSSSSNLAKSSEEDGYRFLFKSNSTNQWKEITPQYDLLYKTYSFKIKESGECLFIRKHVTGLNENERFSKDKLNVQAYPNPFHEYVYFHRNYKTALPAELFIYDLSGKQVLRKEFTGERYRWQGGNSSGHKVSTGVYLYKIKVDDQEQIGKILLLK